MLMEMTKVRLLKKSGLHPQEQQIAQLFGALVPTGSHLLNCSSETSRPASLIQGVIPKPQASRVPPTLVNSAECR